MVLYLWKFQAISATNIDIFVMQNLLWKILREKQSKVYLKQNFQIFDSVSGTGLSLVNGLKH